MGIYVIGTSLIPVITLFGSPVSRIISNNPTPKDPDIMSELRALKVAIVGSGLAGLTAAYLLSKSSTSDVEFEVHVFEKVSMTAICSRVTYIDQSDKGLLSWDGFLVHFDPSSREEARMAYRVSRPALLSAYELNISKCAYEVVSRR